VEIRIIFWSLKKRTERSNEKHSPEKGERPVLLKWPPPERGNLTIISIHQTKHSEGGGTDWDVNGESSTRSHKVGWVVVNSTGEELGKATQKTRNALVQPERGGGLVTGTWGDGQETVLQYFRRPVEEGKEWEASGEAVMRTVNDLKGKSIRELLAPRTQKKEMIKIVGDRYLKGFWRKGVWQVGKCFRGEI